MIIRPSIPTWHSGSQQIIFRNYFDDHCLETKNNEATVYHYSAL